MKRAYKLLICILFALGMNDQSYSQIERIMTYNIRYDNPRDDINKWDSRKEEVAQLVQFYDPEFLGLQEALLHQLEYLDEKLTDYARIGVGRDDGKEKGEFSPIYFHDKVWSLVDNSTFWLSPTDDKISVGWDASMERICTYGLFEHKETNDRILVFNTHYDHIGEVAREKSSELILKKIAEISNEGLPVVLMGDLNAEPDNKAIKLITQVMGDAAQTVKNGIYGPYGTFTGFKPDAIPKRRIDYIFVKNLEVVKYRHIDDRMRNNNYLSDHLPVMLDVKN